MASPPPGITAHIGSVLKARFLEKFDIQLSGVFCSKLARDTSLRGLSLVNNSIRNTGQLPQFAPTVILEEDVIPESGLPADIARSVKFLVLDGNHRVTLVCKELIGEDSLLRFRVYRTLANPADVRLIASGKLNIIQLVVLYVMVSSVHRTFVQSVFSSFLEHVLTVA